MCCVGFGFSKNPSLSVLFSHLVKAKVHLMGLYPTIQTEELLALHKRQPGTEDDHELKGSTFLLQVVVVC